MDERSLTLREAAGRRFDLIVIGGGINGAGIARAAATRGYTVLLLDKQDWGFGTTWRSTKLIHGGLRYLEHGEVGLVFESLRDRAALLRSVPHLVRPLPFLLPVYQGGRGKALLQLGLTIYDVLALGGGLPRHRTLSARAALHAEPALRREGLLGGLAYWDAQVELPERLCLENVLCARDAGAAVFNYVEVKHLLRTGGRVTGVEARDAFRGETFEFQGDVVINAAGPWVDEVLRAVGAPGRRIGGTRGAHVVVTFPGGGPRRALYAEAAGDRRPFFVIPWRGAHLIGTTDIPIESPEATLPSDAEIEYLIEAATRLMPARRLQPTDIWYAYGGIRPLPYSTGRSTGAISRRHHIVDHADAGVRGLYSIVGGKLSTYLSLAEEVIARLASPPARPSRPEADARAMPVQWRPDPADREERRLWRIYGPRAEAVLAEQRRNCGGRRLCAHTLETVGQARYAIEQEGARTIGDVLLRRTPAGWAPCLGRDAAPQVARLLAEHLGWDEGEQAAAVAAYEAELARTFRRV